MQAAQPFFLEPGRLQVVLFGGKGGVGKTTCATAAALSLARSAPSRPVLLVSTDPAHSVADCLAGSPLPPNLRLEELDAPKCLDTFKRAHGPVLKDIALRGTFLDEADIAQFLDLSLPGLDELMAFLEISNWAESGAFASLIVDTAPSGHTLRLLAMPALIRQWLEALEALLAKHHFMTRLFRGATPPDHADRFLAGLAGSVQRMEVLLCDPARSRFVPVMVPTELCLEETKNLIQELKRAHIPVTDLVVNRVFPRQACPRCQAGRAQQDQVLDQVRQHPLFSALTLWESPLYPGEITGVKALAAFWPRAASLENAPVAPAPSSKAFPPRVHDPSPPPDSTRSLLLFAGNGGMERTSLACATGLLLARELPQREVLLPSIDPAHSLTTCLKTAVAAKPLHPAPGLTGLGVDVQADFDALKNLYPRELCDSLRGLPPPMDLTFDREVMDKLLDLSPPAWDEAIAHRPSPLPDPAWRLLLFAGKGGVGKTTLACATSLRLARESPHREVLLLSTDPAHSLTACLGTPVGPKPVRLAPGLTGLELDAQAEFDALKNLYARELSDFLKHLLPQMDLAFDRPAMEKLLDLSPPGLDEIMALSQMTGLLEQHTVVVLDTAPTGHLIRLLEMPALIDQWLKAFFGVFLKYKNILRLPKITQRLIELSKDLKRLMARLKDPRQCALYAVTIPTLLAFEETRDLLAACQRMEVPCAALFLNLVTPPADCPVCAALHRSESAILTRFRQTFPDLPQTRVYRQHEPRGLPALADLGRLLYQTVPQHL